jgi:GPH family glycoside/pentoside/hexuronide:cation symporter
MSSAPLSLRAKIGYGIGEINGSLFWTAVAFFLLNYLTDSVGLAAGLAGTALLVGKIWDAVSDPLVGFLSDRTRSRWGRRRPWLLFAALPFGLMFFLMFTSPGPLRQTGLFLWAMVAYILLCTAYTCVTIPYNSLLPELSDDFSERTRISGFKMTFGVLGTLVGAAAVKPLLGVFPSQAQGYMVVGAVFGLIISASALVPFFAVREPARRVTPPSSSLLVSAGQTFRNRPFVLIMTAWTFNTLGLAVVTATLVYYFKYVLRQEGMLTIGMAILLVCAMAFIPVSVKVSERVGKRTQYILGMSIVSVAVLLIFAFGHTAGIPFVYGVMALAGMGLSTHYVMPWSIFPDTVEYGYLLTGDRHEGIYYGVMNFFIKAGQAIAGFLTGIVLELFQYVPNIPQSARAVLGIRLLLGPLTVVFFIVANVTLAFYPLTREKYEEIRRDIARMEEKARPD